MKLTFLGTKGYIEEYSNAHYYHSSLLIEHKKFKLLIDHGIKSRKLEEIVPDAIIITHAHPDAFTWLLKDEKFKGKIYVTRATKKLARFKKNFELIKVNRWFKVCPFKILAYSVVHSLIAPAVGFKIRNIVYNPDLVVPRNKAVLRGADMYIGDGSSVRGNLIRRRDGKLFGHARISTQIKWCEKYGIKKIIFTHFGKEAVEMGDKKLKSFLNGKAAIAYDGMTL